MLTNLEGVLDELEFLATVEHALIVEYLSVCCALGHDLEAQDGGPTTDRTRQAAGAAAGLAFGEMIHFRDINRALVASNRTARIERADRIDTAAGPISLVPPDEPSLQRLLEREEAIAKAVDHKYAQLVPAVTSDPVFKGELLDEWRRVILENGPSHVGALTDLRTALHGLAPTDFLRATRRDANGAFEQRLLDTNDRMYGLVLTVLRGAFDPNPDVAGAFSGVPFPAMQAMDESNRLLVQRGLLPPFT